MINQIIKFLGGRTNEEYNLLTIEYNAQRALADLYRAREAILTEQIKEETTERKFLQELIFKRFGVTVPEETPESSEPMQPIRTSPRRWSLLKTAMERDDHERVKNAQA